LVTCYLIVRVSGILHETDLFDALIAVYPDGRVCISILHPPGDDPNGYELASERWTPVHTVGHKHFKLVFLSCFHWMKLVILNLEVSTFQLQGWGRLCEVNILK
jgi:hypothetical protein